MIRIALLASLLVACLPLPPEHTYDDQRTLTVSWSIKGPGDAPAACPPGFDTILVKACVEPDADYTCFPTLVPCAATGSVTTQLYTSGKVEREEGTFLDVSKTYYASVSIADASGENVRATSFTTEVDLSSDASTELAVYPDAGFGLVSWTLEVASTGEEVSACATAGVDEIGIEYYPLVDGVEGAHVKTRWPCTSQVGEPDPDAYLGAGLTPALAKGEYIAEPIAYRAGAELPRPDTTYLFDVDGRNSVSTVRLTFEIADR